VAGVAKDSFAFSEDDRNGQQQKTVDKIGIQQLRINGNGPRGASIIGCEDRFSVWPDEQSNICLLSGRERRTYCSFVYSALASFRIGTSGSASFQSAKKS
jgi:hypothetical protein